MEISLIDQGINLMLFGMGTVFIFLSILVIATTLMSNVVNKVNPAKPDVIPNTVQAKAPAIKENIDTNIIAAIEKGIAAHRANK